MTHYDVFNGDADGLCALQQLRLHHPIDDAILVTGVKRDITLLDWVDAGQGDTISVLDISLDKNRHALMRLLEGGTNVEYFDHHFAGEIPQTPHLSTHIDTSAETCTSLLVDAFLNGAHRAWAVVGAFGDNFHAAASRAAKPLDLSTAQLEILCELGTCLNYNAYGSDLEDLFFPPQDLARTLRPYNDPFDFVHNEHAYRTLRAGYADDMGKAEALKAEFEEEKHALFVLPGEAWTRRVSGVFGNLLARRYPQRAHAILTRLEDGAYRISIRAPLTTKSGADALCREFPSGGGRAAAAGINHLEASDYEHFLERFRAHFN